MTFNELEVGKFYRIDGGLDNTAICFVKPEVLLLLFKDTGSIGPLTLINKEVIDTFKSKNFTRIKPKYLSTFSLIFSNKFISYI